MPASFKSARSRAGKRRHLRALLADSPPMSESERQAVKESWRTDAAQLVFNAAVPPSDADQALETLLVAYDRFGAETGRLTLDDVR